MIDLPEYDELYHLMFVSFNGSQDYAPEEIAFIHGEICGHLPSALA